MGWQTASEWRMLRLGSGCSSIAEDVMDKKAKTPKKPKTAKAKGTKGA